MILYCDVVSKKPKIALLDHTCITIEENFFGEKVSEEFHEKIYFFLKKFSIQELIAVLGPGSYTGLRLIDLFSFLWQKQGKSYFSFYYFEYAQFLQKPFISYAYKQESFVMNKTTPEFIPYEKKSYPHYCIMPGEEIFYPEAQILNPLDQPDFLQKMKNQNRQLKPYYYRTIENEFKKTS